jgi:hypothetical protein
VTTSGQVSRERLPMICSGTTKNHGVITKICGATADDYKKTTDDLYWDTNRRWPNEPEFFRVHLKRENRPKRDIVDTSFHASCAFGHTPMLGSGFSYSWEMESKGLEKGRWGITGKGHIRG